MDLILIFILGLFLGFVLSLFYFKNFVLKNSLKNLINRDFVKRLFISVGRTPSEKQINEVMNKLKF